ncbi:MAG: hypothetical protein H6923_02390 [Alphaproteobacteria bacterium]|nr:hypothetical protein [Alphaproteobacteria bacterium]
MPSLHTQSHVFLVVAIAGVMALALALAFGLGYVRELERGLLDPRAVPNETLAALDRAELRLGPPGALGLVHRFLAESDPVLLDELDQAIGSGHAALSRAIAVGGGLIEDPDALLWTERSLSDVAKRLRLGADVDAMTASVFAEAAYRSLAAEISRVERREMARRILSLHKVTVFGQALIAVALLFVVGMALAFATILRRSVREPMDALLQSLVETDADGAKGKVWGLSRDDEYGTLARAIARYARDGGSGAAEGPAQGSAVRDALARLEALAVKAAPHGEAQVAGSDAADRSAGPLPAMRDAVRRIDALQAEIARVSSGIGEIEAALAPKEGESSGAQAAPVEAEAERAVVTLIEIIESANGLAARLSALADHETTRAAG